MHLGINLSCHVTRNPEAIGAAIECEANDIEIDEAPPTLRSFEGRGTDEPLGYDALCALVSEVFEPVSRKPMAEVEPYEYRENERRAIISQIGHEDAWAYNDLASLPVAS